MSEWISYKGSDGWPLFARAVARKPDDQSALPMVLMHGGGPDHESILPLAMRLRDLVPVLLPDIRGYGRSACAFPDRHSWDQYSDDVAALLDHVDAQAAIVGGAGLGGTIALRTALRHPSRVKAVIVMSLEDIEDDERKAAEVAFMDAFAERVRTRGLQEGWRPILPHLAPVIGKMVGSAIPRSDRASIAAAAAIGRDRAFRDVKELASIIVPALICPGMDWRHPRALAAEAVQVMPAAILGDPISSAVRDEEDFADALAPQIKRFLNQL
jgi:3-oxoadipate enol-lactonase